MYLGKEIHCTPLLLAIDESETVQVDRGCDRGLKAEKSKNSATC